MIPGPKVLLYGESGSGKTYAIRTLIECGITPFVIFTENGMRTISDVPADKLHWVYIPPADISWGDMGKIGQTINRQTYEDMAANKNGVEKNRHTQLLKFYETCNKFVCQRTGEDFGSVQDWGTDKALVVDSLSGLSMMAKGLTVGAKPTLHQGEWSVAMNTIESVVNKLCLQLWTTCIITAHAERETDPVAGSVKIYPSSLGAKLSPKLPRYFDDVVYCESIEKGFTWATAHRMAVVKNRNLPKGDNLKPNFATIIDPWKKAGGIIAPTHP